MQGSIRASPFPSAPGHAARARCCRRAAATPLICSTRGRGGAEESGSPLRAPPAPTHAASTDSGLLIERRAFTLGAAGCCVLGMADDARALDLKLGGDGLFAQIDSARGDAGALRNPGVSWTIGNASKQLYYPDWLEGEWEVSATLRGVATPMGKRFLTRQTPGATKYSLIAVVADIGAGADPASPVKYRMRFSRAGGAEGPSVVADRPFNIQQQVDAFGVYPSVREVLYEPAENPTRVGVVYTTPRRDGGAEDQRKAELFVNQRRSEGGAGGSFLAQETYRQVNQASGSGDVFDYTAIWEFKQAGEGRVDVRQRVAGFLNPQDGAYFDVGSKAVLVADYTMELTRAVAGGGGGEAEQAV